MRAPTFLLTTFSSQIVLFLEGLFRAENIGQIVMVAASEDLRAAWTEGRHSVLPCHGKRMVPFSLKTLSKYIGESGISFCSSVFNPLDY